MLRFCNQNLAAAKILSLGLAAASGGFSIYDWFNTKLHCIQPVKVFTSCSKRFVLMRRTPQLMSNPTPPGDTTAFGSYK